MKVQIQTYFAFFIDTIKKKEFSKTVLTRKGNYYGYKIARCFYKHLNSVYC